MMASWSIDSGDTYDTVSVGSAGGGNNRQHKQQQKQDGNGAAREDASDVDSSSSTLKASNTAAAASVGSTIPKTSSLPTTSKSAASEADAGAGGALPFQSYQISHSTEINSEDRAFFGISAPRGRSDRSHRTVRFRFGRLGSTAAAAGVRSVGEDEEHEVVLSWSVRTGKRIISYDRIILYTLTLKGFGVCDHTLLTPDGKFSLRLLSCADAPLGASHDFATSELIVNGISYFDLPRMGRDGTMIPPTDRRVGGSNPVDARTGRIILYTVGEVLCPDVVEMSRKEIGFVTEEENVVN